MVKKVLLTLLAVVAIGILAVLGLASTKPNTYRVERSAIMAAPPGIVFALVNDFNRFHEWSPWEKIDPNMTKEIGGGGAGVGATYYWKGNRDAGEGRMTIVESIPDSKVGMTLEFIDWKMTSRVELDLEPADQGTRVTWSMSGDNNFMAKVMSVFMDMDATVGKDFEEGLSNLARLAENQPAPTPGMPPTREGAGGA